MISYNLRLLLISVMVWSTEMKDPFKVSDLAEGACTAGMASIFRRIGSGGS
jgi:hypothetical protein